MFSAMISPLISRRLNPIPSQGYRVLVFGSYQGIPDGKELTGPVTPLGYVLLSNPIRKEAPDTFR